MVALGYHTFCTLSLPFALFPFRAFTFLPLMKCMTFDFPEEIAF